jgi:UDP:flavonoid glycosyltransferase YjiC (YdhE family)
VPLATLVPHFYPPTPPGLPPYGLGAMPGRGPHGRALWRALARPTRVGVERGRRELNETRRRVGLPLLERPYGGISQDLCIVGTFPQLEYPRAWPAGTCVVGPLLWEPPSEGDVQPPPGDGPVVLVAPSTSQDPSQRLLRSALEGLADLPVRVLAATNRQGVGAVPANARAVDWLSYARTMPRCDAVVCHGGHGTVARALASGCAVVVVPAGGDMSENAARVDWAGVGTRLPRRFVTPRGVRLAVGKALASERIRERVAEVAAWCAEHDGPAHAADLVEQFGADRTRRPLSA